MVFSRFMRKVGKLKDEEIKVSRCQAIKSVIFNGMRFAGLLSVFFRWHFLNIFSSLQKYFLMMEYRLVIKCVLLWLPLLLLLPITLSIVVPLFGYKICVIICAKMFRKQDLIRAVEGLDVCFSTDDFYGRPLGSIGFLWVINGRLSYQLVVDRLEGTLLSVEGGGYEKLTSLIPSFWMGYPFWRRAPKIFDVRNHLKVLEHFGNQTDDAMNKMVSEWMLEPFEEGIPLWEIRLLEFSERKSILLFKTHHMLGDGYSMISLLNKITDSHTDSISIAPPNSNPPQLHSKRIAYLNKILNESRLLFLTPLTIVSLLDQFVFHGDAWFTSKKCSENVNWTSTSVSMGTLVKIRKNLRKCGIGTNLGQAPVNVIVVSALGGALRRLFMEETEEEEEVPKESHFVVALPLPNETHPGSRKFSNFWTHGILTVEMKEEDPLRRLSSLQSFYRNMEAQATPEIYFWLLKLFEILPRSVLKIITNFNMGASIGVTMVAGPSQQISIGGQKVTQKLGYAGLLWRHASLFLSLVSYNGRLEISLLANESVIKGPSKLRRLLSKYFVEELESLGN